MVIIDPSTRGRVKHQYSFAASASGRHRGREKGITPKPEQGRPFPGWALTEQAKDCHRRLIRDGGALSMIFITWAFASDLHTDAQRHTGRPVRRPPVGGCHADRPTKPNRRRRQPGRSATREWRPCYMHRYAHSLAHTLTHALAHSQAQPAHPPRFHDRPGRQHRHGPVHRLR